MTLVAVLTLIKNQEALALSRNSPIRKSRFSLFSAAGSRGKQGDVVTAGKLSAQKMRHQSINSNLLMIIKAIEKQAECREW